MRPSTITHTQDLGEGGLHLLKLMTLVTRRHLYQIISHVNRGGKKLIGLIQTGSAKIKLDNENKITLDVSENNNKRIAVARLLNELV